jgi:hypothetical protein
MTSSERHLSAGQRRWDYSVQRYKSYDVFCEKDLLSILFLAHGRPDITTRCLLSTLDAVKCYAGEVEWILIENGSCDQNFAFFQELPVERKVIVRQNNYGINNGLNQAWALSRGEWCLIHENDWECRTSVDFLKIVKDILTERSEVGIVQLRAVNDPCENWGYGKPEYNPWSCGTDALAKSNVKLWRERTKSGHEFFVSDFPNGFNNNPIVIRKSLYRECGTYPEAEIGTDPRHGETEYQGRVAATDCVTAHIGTEVYYHCGQKTTRAN